MAVDDIKIQHGSCRKDQDLDCNFDDSMCRWDQDTNWKLRSFTSDTYNGDFFVHNGEKQLELLNSGSISTSVTTVFCLRFYYTVYDKSDNDEWRLRLRQQSMPNKDEEIDKISGKRNKKLTIYETPVFLNEDSNIIISTYMHGSGKIGIDDIYLIPGSCDQVKGDVDERKMCTVINAEDNERISVAYCSTMKRQTYLCEIEEMQQRPIPGVCNEAQFLSNTESPSEGNHSEIPTTSLASSQLPLEENITGVTKSGLQETTEINTTFVVSDASLLGTYKATQNLGFPIAVGVLSLMVIVLSIVLLCLLLNSRRKKVNYKEHNTLNNSPAAANEGYEMQGITDNEQDNNAAPKAGVQQRPKQLTAGANVTHTDGYQIVDTKDQKHESLVYQDMNEGEYDHMGGSRDRKLDLNNTGDPTYDHAQSVKPRVDDTYDTTKVQTDFNYFKLEPENNSKDGSAIYDHTT